MPAIHVIGALLVHFAVLISGLYFYSIITNRMKKDGVNKIPSFTIILIITNYCCILLAIITMSTNLLLFEGVMIIYLLIYSMFIAPIIMGFIVSNYIGKRNENKYYKWIFRLSAIYAVIMPVIGFYIISNIY